MLKGLSNLAESIFNSDGSQFYTTGTWTPTVIGQTTAGTNTYSIQQGDYLTIGKYTTISFDILVSGANTGTGNMVIAGLPISGVDDNSSGILIPNNITLPSAGAPVIGLVVGSQILLMKGVSGGSAARYTNTDFGSNARIAGTLTYKSS